MAASAVSSPKRVFSTSKSSILNALDLDGSASMSSSDGDPFGEEWPPKKRAVPEGTGERGSDMSKAQRMNHRRPSSALGERTKVAQWPPPRQKDKSDSLNSDSAISLKQIPTSSSSTTVTRPPPSLLSSCSSAIPRPKPKPIPKSAKENAAIQPSPPITLEPPLVHPLPIYSYKDFKPSPTRVYVRHEKEANDLVGSFSGAVGFDLEWRVFFCKGATARPVATVQLSDRRMILVIQVSAMKGFPKKLKELLEDPKIAKVGVNILNDGNKLARDYGVCPQGLIELGRLAQQADKHCNERFARASLLVGNATSSSSGSSAAPKKLKAGSMINLATVTAMYTGCELPKGPVRSSNWEARPLSETQLEYAANDAHCALIVYDRLIEMAEAAKVVLEPAKYTYGVRADYWLSSETKAAPVPAKPAPVFRAPALSSKTSSSSSASSSLISASSSGYTVGSYSSTTSTSTSISCRPQPSSSTASEVHTKPKKAISSVSYAEVSDDDVEVLEVRVVRTVNQPTPTTSTSTLSTRSSAASDVTSSSEPASRGGRPGPRFKPSYNMLTTTNPPRSVSPSKHNATNAVPTATDIFQVTSPPSRSPRFKPCYDGVSTSRSVSPVKASAAGTTDNGSGASSPRSAPLPLPEPPQTSTSTLKSTSTLAEIPYQPTNQRPQHIRAYNLWHFRQLSLSEICSTLRSLDNPLKASTVISYVVAALQTDPKLHFSRDRLRALLSSDPKSWLYYRDWFRTLNAQRHVNMQVDQPKDR